MTLRVFPMYLSLADSRNDDYFRLITVEIPHEFGSDVKPKLKVYKGTALISEQNLPGIPSSVQTLYVDDHEPRIPGKFEWEFDSIGSVDERSSSCSK